jgi:hypothetical protein
MIPIYEQVAGDEIGYRVNAFLRRFDALCAESTEAEPSEAGQTEAGDININEGSAAAFAFFFYDSINQGLRQIMSDEGVVNRLERLAAGDLHLFYLHASKPKSIQRFNTEFLTALGAEEAVQLPCVVFFRYQQNANHGQQAEDQAAIRDVAIAAIDNANLPHGFKELYGAITHYKAREPNPAPELYRHLRWIEPKGAADSLEAVRGGLRRTLDQL